MSGFEDSSFSLEGFAGKVRLFPLPNLVLFPHVMQPLHLFEPRYRRLLEDALAGDGLIAMALLKPGWETDYDGRPPLYPMACLGRIATHHRLEDGTYNVLLLGLGRVRIVRELPTGKLYREAEAKLCEDEYPSHDSSEQASLQRKLRDAFLRVLPTLPEGHEQMDQLLAGDMPLGVLTDLVGYMLDIPVSDKLGLLNEANVHRRAELLLGHLATSGQSPAKASKCFIAGFPPQFSAN